MGFHQSCVVTMLHQVPVFPYIKRELIQTQCTLADIDARPMSNAQTEAEFIGRTLTSAQVYWI